MTKNRTSFWLHLLLFVVVEVIFVFILFRELPETNILSAIGIGHISYWLIILFAWAVREQLRHVRQRFLATYLPIVYHVVVHLWIGFETIHAGEVRHEWEEIRIIIGAIIAGGLILWWEILLHRKYHCDTHHVHTHEHCEEDGHEDCEEPHKTH